VRHSDRAPPLTRPARFVLPIARRFPYIAAGKGTGALGRRRDVSSPAVPRPARADSDGRPTARFSGRRRHAQAVELRRTAGQGRSTPRPLRTTNRRSPRSRLAADDGARQRAGSPNGDATRSLVGAAVLGEHALRSDRPQTASRLGAARARRGSTGAAAAGRPRRGRGRVSTGRGRDARKPGQRLRAGVSRRALELRPMPRPSLYRLEARRFLGRRGVLLDRSLEGRRCASGADDHARQRRRWPDLYGQAALVQQAHREHSGRDVAAGVAGRLDDVVGESELRRHGRQPPETEK